MLRIKSYELIKCSKFLNWLEYVWEGVRNSSKHTLNYLPYLDNAIAIGRQDFPMDWRKVCLMSTDIIFSHSTIHIFFMIVQFNLHIIRHQENKFVQTFH